VKTYLCFCVFLLSELFEYVFHWEMFHTLVAEENWKKKVMVNIVFWYILQILR